MKYARITYLVIAIFGILIVAIQLGSAVDKIGCEGQLLVGYDVAEIEGGSLASQPVWQGQSLGQSFLAPYDNLDQIDIYVLVPSETLGYDVVFKLFQLPSAVDNLSDAVLLFEVTVSADNFADQTWHTFPVPVIPNSSGIQYAFTLEAPDVTEAQAIRLTGVSKDAYQNGTAFVQGQPFDVDVRFNSCYDLTIGEKIGITLTQLTNERPSLWGRGLFYVVILAIYGGLIVLLYWFLIRQLPS